MEASNGAHYWAQVLADLGHEVRLISPQFVTPYVTSNKNDRNDAEAICEAVGRPSMRFVPPKTPGRSSSWTPPSCSCARADRRLNGSDSGCRDQHITS